MKPSTHAKRNARAAKAFARRPAPKPAETKAEPVQPTKLVPEAQPRKRVDLRAAMLLGSMWGMALSAPVPDEKQTNNAHHGQEDRCRH